MLPEKDPERENTYDIDNHVASENDKNENSFFATLVSIFRF
jgi:hypothetical protein